MKNKLIISSVLFVSTLAVQPAMAENSVQHSGRASEHGFQSLGHASVAGSKLIFGAVAVPLSVAGAAGHVSGQMGGALWDAANAPIGKPLPVTDETVTVGPSPKQAVTGKGE